MDNSIRLADAHEEARLTTGMDLRVYTTVKDIKKMKKEALEKVRRGGVV